MLTILPCLPVQIQCRPHVLRRHFMPAVTTWVIMCVLVLPSPTCFLRADSGLIGLAQGRKASEWSRRAGGEVFWLQTSTQQQTTQTPEFLCATATVSRTTSSETTGASLEGEARSMLSHGSPGVHFVLPFPPHSPPPAALPTFYLLIYIFIYL